MLHEDIHTSAEGSGEALTTIELTAMDKNLSAEGWQLMARRLATAAHS